MQILTRKKGVMKFKNAKRIIDEIYKELFVLTAYFQGEPLIDDSFFQIVKYASAKNIFTISSTNAQFLNEDNAKKIIDSGLDRLIVSLDGYDQNSYHSYRIGGDFEKVINGIKILKRQRTLLKKSTPAIIAQCLILKTTEKNLPEIKKMALEAGADKVVFKTAQFYDTANIDKLFPSNKASRYELKNGELKITGKLPNHCKRLWSSPVVTWNGDLVPCCFDKDADHSFGKPTDGSFKEIWSGKESQKFRKKLLIDRKKIKICRNCSEGL